MVQFACSFAASGIKREVGDGSAAAQPATAVRPVVLFVLGMARSGTSALTRVLSLCSGTLPAGMMGANSGNPLGYWEPRAAVCLNEAILQRHGSTMFDPSLRLQEESAFAAKEKAACIAEIRAFLTTLPAAPLVVIKDPRIALLSGLWFEAAQLDGFDVVTAIAVRHPQEVIASLGAKARVSPELAGALWLKYNLVVERHAYGVPRVFVDYANLLDNWRGEIKRISAALEVDLDTQDEGAIDEFLTPDLRRQRHCGSVTEPFGTEWISPVYETLRAAARDEPWDRSVLDRVFEAYRASEYGFRMAFEDSRRLDKRNRLLPLPIMKLGLEGLAMAHRCKGVWA
ncbi:MAG TPA: hypothetical protein VMT05_00155 [Terriglobales bacterium]|nr:hypothetical protein [Terriglobales bacterium]